MGDVYRAHDTRLQRDVALKVIRSARDADPVAKDRLIREARAASMLDHPNVCTVYEVDESADGRLFIAMAYCPGRTIEERLRSGGISPDEVSEIGRQIAEGLTAAHARGIVHRDVKPGNIIITDEACVKIVDFGIAQLAETRLTREGGRVGTPAYMAPEQFHGAAVDARADVWAFGTLLYEMLTGRRPFSADYEQAEMYRILNDEPDPVDADLPAACNGLVEIIRACLQKDPDLRPSMKEVAEWLRAEPGTSAVTAPALPSAAWRGLTNRRVAISAVGGVLILLAGLVLMVSLMDAERIWFAGGTAPSPSGARGEVSIGVMAFANMSEDPENEHFADGISEEILNILAGVEGLRVASRTSAFSFKGQGAGVPEIARALNVSHVLEGSVRRQGGRVRITAQLIRADTDDPLWSQAYDRDLTDIFQVQQEIARAITGALEDVLGTRRVMVAASTEDLEVYDRFLRGRALFHNRTELDRAIADLRWAVEREPGFGEAWTYLAAAYYVAPGYDTDIPRRAARSGAAHAIGRAGRLAPEDPLVLAIRGSMRQDAGDFVGAIDLLRRAAGMRTPDSTPLLWYGVLLVVAGYAAESLEVLEHAAAMDPMSGVIQGWIAQAHMALGNVEEAEIHSRRALDLDWPGADWQFALELFRRGDLERASEWWGEPSNDEVRAPDFGAMIDPRRRGELLEATDAVLGPLPLLAWRREDEYLDRAFAALRDGLFEGWSLVGAWHRSAPRLREHPRFLELARQVGLVELWEARGYPPGCTRIAPAGGERLDCPGMRLPVRRL